MEMQRTGTATYLLVRGRSLGDSLGDRVLLTCLFSAVCLASVTLIDIRSGVSPPCVWAVASGRECTA